MSESNVSNVTGLEKAVREGIETIIVEGEFARTLREALKIQDVIKDKGQLHGTLMAMPIAQLGLWVVSTYARIAIQLALRLSVLYAIVAVGPGLVWQVTNSYKRGKFVQDFEESSARFWLHKISTIS